MASYRRYVARHPLALARALRQVRLHEWETHGKVQRSGRWAVLEVPLTLCPMTVDVKPPAAFFDSLAELGQKLSVVRIPAPAFTQPIKEPYGLCPDCKGPNLAPGLVHQCPADPVLAYRSKLGGLHWCTDCATPAVIRFGIPLTSEDLPDGGLCSVCDRDLLIVVPAPNPFCSICEHAPHGGEAGCHCGCRGQR